MRRQCNLLLMQPPVGWPRSVRVRLEVPVDERIVGRVREVLLSPVHGVLDPKELVAWTLEDRLNVRVQLQLHKYIWGADAQGV